MRFGIVGAGSIGNAHKRALLNHADCEITAICDLSLEKAEQLAEGTGARVYTDYRTMQENEQLDAVILNLPHFLHKDVSVYFLERNVPVMVEKPMAITTEECDAMIAAAHSTNTPFAVGHVQRYMSNLKKAKELIESKELGQLTQMVEVRNTDYFSPDRPRWFLDKKLAGGGILMNYGAHTLDKFLYATGLEVEHVAAAGNNFQTTDTIEGSAQLLLTFSGGVTAVCSYCGGCTPFVYDTWFYFTNGSIHIDYLNSSQLEVCRGTEEKELIVLPQDAIFYEQLTEFIKLIRGEESYVATPEFSRKVIAVLEDALQQING